jgi:hypothetical protein
VRGFRGAIVCFLMGMPKIKLQPETVSGYPMY